MCQIVVVSDQEVGGLIAILPPLYGIFWLALVLFIILFPVGRYALPRTYKMIDEHATKIEEGLGVAKQTKAGQTTAALKREKITRKTHTEAHAIREYTNDEVKVIVVVVRYEVTSEANRTLEAPECQIFAKKQTAQTSLRSEVGLLTPELAEKTIGEHFVDAALISCVVDRFLSELKVDSARVEEEQ